MFLVFVKFTILKIATLYSAESLETDNSEIFSRGTTKKYLVKAVGSHETRNRIHK